MKNRRDFIKLTAGAAALGALGTHDASAAGDSKLRKVWVLSDLHCGYSEGGKDGSEWFELACKDMQSRISQWQSRFLQTIDPQHGSLFGG
jgi:hypothetical protein